jgi:Protein of unknown function (DUF2946)
MKGWHLQCRFMRAARAHAQFTSWIAILAVLLASLAPTLAHAFRSDAGVSWIEVCTTQGAKWIQAGDDTPERAPATAHVIDHCPYCSLHTPTLALPPTATPAPALLPLSHEVPPAFLAAPRTLHAWVSAQPRAPPLFS